MLKIVLCDDEEQVTKQLQGYFERIQARHGFPLSLEICRNGEELSACDFHSVDVLLLDIQLEKENGMDLARKIRKSFPGLTILFVTNYAQYAIAGYQVQAFDFIKKPVTYEHLERVMTPCLQRLLQEQKKSLFVKNDRGLFQIPERQIEYVETWRGHVLLHRTDGESIESYSAMNAVEKQLSREDFFRCHTSYLINLEFVKEVLAKDIVMKSQTVLAVSKHRRKELLVRIANYWGNRFL